MFDDLRNDTNNQASFYTDDLQLDSGPKKSKKNRKSGRILGMTALQRLVLSVLLFTLTCLGGFLLMIVTSKMVIF